MEILSFDMGCRGFENSSNSKVLFPRFGTSTGETNNILFIQTNHKCAQQLISNYLIMQHNELLNNTKITHEHSS